MTATRARGGARPAPRRPGARAKGRRRSRSGFRLTREWRLLLALALLAIDIGVVQSIWMGIPPSLLAVPLVIASFALGPRPLPWFVVFVLLIAAGTVPFHEVTREFVVQVLVLFLLGLIVLLGSFRRSRLGVAGNTGESMFVDLRDRIQRQSGVPELPPGWTAESVVRSAGGTPFAGDFLVAAPGRGDRLDVAVVDVSGKGEGAGTRALLLSGAFAGLLGAVPPDRFLDTANDYLLRQDWDEGFATAIHLSLDLRTGTFQLRTAGHPPAVQFVAGSGRWLVHETWGPALGILPDADFVAFTGQMRSGDALLLYTDGLVETKDRDISLGIDKMIGQAERLLHGGFERGATRLLDSLGSANDDRALVLIHRH